MWSDNETNRDFLNFRTVADTAAEMIYRAGGKPLSMGISGGWGVGKSSMVKLIRESLSERFGEKFVFVEFNAWLYQGFDDAKAALMEVIAQSLLEYGQKNQKSVEKVLEFLGRVNWVRAAGFAARVVAAVKTVGTSEVALRAVQAVRGDVQQEDVAAVETTGKELADAGAGILRPKKTETPPKEIQS